MVAWTGEYGPRAAEAGRSAGRNAQAEVGTDIKALLDADIDDQQSTPLAILRSAVTYPTAVLKDLGVPPIDRDPFAERVFPADIYGLTPASLADLDPGLSDIGIAWGAAKAMEHKRRHSSG